MFISFLIIHLKYKKILYDKKKVLVITAVSAAGGVVTGAFVGAAIIPGLPLPVGFPIVIARSNCKHITLSIVKIHKPV